MLLAGVALILVAIWKGAFTKSTKGIWFAFPGTVLVVMAVFFLAGFNGTAYYPSSTDLQSSLTIRNSSSSYFTLKVMTWVSFLIPFVLAYIVFAWRAMDRKKITRAEIEGTLLYPLVFLSIDFGITLVWNPEAALSGSGEGNCGLATLKTMCMARG